MHDFTEKQTYKLHRNSIIKKLQNISFKPFLFFYSNIFPEYNIILKTNKDFQKSD